MKKKKNKTGKRPAEGKKLLENAGLALKHDFFLEASWILSTALEKRLKRFLVKIESEKKGTGYTLEQTIKRLKYLHLSGKDLRFTEHFGIGLIDELRHWKNQRNAILTDMRNIHVSRARIERLAVDGIRLLKDWNRAAKHYKSAVSESLPG